MKAAPILLIPVAAAWFGGWLWWVGRTPGCGCASAPAAVVAPLTLGAASTTPVQQVAATPVIQAATGPAPAQAVAAAAAPAQLFTVYLVKNQNSLASGTDMAGYLIPLLPYLNAHADASITITGHTDADGDATLNRQLSLSRAEQVKAMLVTAGVPENRITTEGAGADRPIADNITSKGKALNRRVEISLVSGTAPPSTPTP